MNRQGGDRRKTVRRDGDAGVHYAEQLALLTLRHFIRGDASVEQMFEAGVVLEKALQRRDEKAAEEPRTTIRLKEAATASATPLAG